MGEGNNVAESLSPPPFREELIGRQSFLLTALWQRWLDVLFRRQASVETRMADLEARVTLLEGP